MKREKRCKVTWGPDGCTLSELRDALDAIESDLGSGCEITFNPVSNGHMIKNRDGMALIAGIAGYVEVDR